MEWSQVEAELLKNKKLKREYEKIDLPHAIAKSVIDARIALNMTQADLARRMNTKQPSIARIEAGNSLPSLSFLQKMAEVFETELIPPAFAFMNSSYTYNQVNLTSFSFPTAREVFKAKPILKNQEVDYVYKKEYLLTHCA